MPEYEYKGIPSTPTVASGHILEYLHRHSTPVRRREIVKYVEHQHRSSGGTIVRDPFGSVKAALGRLVDAGKVVRLAALGYYSLPKEGSEQHSDADETGGISQTADSLRAATGGKARARSNKPRPQTRPRIFVVHGRDDGAKDSVARFLERIGLRPIILHELANRGRTIISKFRDEAADVGFAVVLMTPDDQGGIAGKTTRPRARQNVIFELGFFIGALGLDRVAALVGGEVEQPSDFDGVVYIPFDPQGAWRRELGKELQAAGLAIDWNKVMAE
jgi:predicted nucleotide-binding protein